MLLQLTCKSSWTLPPAGDSRAEADGANCAQAQHRRIVELERASLDTMQRLRASEQGRLKAEGRMNELQQELENNAGTLGI